MVWGLQSSFVVLLLGAPDQAMGHHGGRHVKANCIGFEPGSRRKNKRAVHTPGI